MCDTDLHFKFGFWRHQGQCHLLDDDLCKLEHSTVQGILDAERTKTLEEHRAMRLVLYSNNC